MTDLWAHGIRAPIPKAPRTQIVVVQPALFYRQVFVKIMVFPIDNCGVDMVSFHR